MAVQASYKQVVLFGDSLLQNSSDVQDGFSFQGALQSYCIRRLDVVNRGFSGYNTKNALEILPEVFPPRSESTPKIEFLVVLLGANDASLDIPTNKQHVPKAQYEQNLKKILTHERIMAHEPKKIMLVTPPPLDQIRLAELDAAYRPASNNQLSHNGEVTRKAAVSAEYSQIARDVAKDVKKEMEKMAAAGAKNVPDVVSIDLHKAIMEVAIAMTPDHDPNGPTLGYPSEEGKVGEGKRGALKTLMPDGLHMNGDAYRVFFHLIKAQIGPFSEFPKQEPYSYVFKPWRDMNPGSI